MIEFLITFLLMMGLSAVFPLAYALSKSKRDFMFRTFLFNTRKRFCIAFLLNFLVLSLVTYEPTILDVVGMAFTFLFQVPAKPNVYFLAGAVSILTVVAIRGDNEITL